MTEIRQWTVPARVAVLGEHLAPVGGPAVHLPVDRGLRVKARPRDDADLHLWAHGGHSSRPTPGPFGADVVVESTLPPGALFDETLDRALALVFGGVEEPATDTPVPTWHEDGLALVVVETHVAHPIGDAERARRREEAAAAATELGLERLVDVDLTGLVRLSDPVLAQRARHVLTETTRVRAADKVLRTGSWEQLGTMLTSSHESLRDDWSVSSVELDLVVATALENGALGARLTGGGFGGAAIALVPIDRMTGLRDAVLAGFAARQWAAPELFSVRPVPRR